MSLRAHLLEAITRVRRIVSISRNHYVLSLLNKISSFVFKVSKHLHVITIDNQDPLSSTSCLTDNETFRSMRVLICYSVQRKS